MGIFGFGDNDQSDIEVQLILDVIFNYEKTLNELDDDDRKKALIDYALRASLKTPVQKRENMI